jgi:hypothetical protein
MKEGVMEQICRMYGASAVCTYYFVEDILREENIL